MLAVMAGRKNQSVCSTRSTIESLLAYLLLTTLRFNHMTGKRLERKVFWRDTQVVARDLLGKTLVRRIGRNVLMCRIVEVESYVGHSDSASHAARGRTPRTEIMFGLGGRAYVYFVYGMYWCLNVVTEATDFPAAILIRAGEPLQGIEQMKRARKRDKIVDLASGPGKLCQAMSITGALNGEDMATSKKLFIVDDGFKVRNIDIVQSPRIGVAYAGEHALNPWRYFIKDSPYVSKL